MDPADRQQPVSELRHLERSSELTLEDGDVIVAEIAPPRGGGGGGGEFIREEVVGGGGDLREIVDVRIFRQRILEARERGSARSRRFRGVVLVVVARPGPGPGPGGVVVGKRFGNRIGKRSPGPGIGIRTLGCDYLCALLRFAHLVFLVHQTCGVEDNGV